MKLPGYMKVVKTTRTEEGLTMTIRIRWWLPTFWFAFIERMVTRGLGK